jgi:mannose/fructose/N-acetylgalactosamine-specific phosphotransferase system component IIC
VVEIIPLWLVNVLSFITVFSVMAAIGTTITPSVSIRHLRSPSLLVRGLVSVPVIVPAIGFATTIAFGLALPETGRCGLDGDCPWCAASLAPGIGVGC